MNNIANIIFFGVILSITVWYQIYASYQTYRKITTKYKWCEAWNLRPQWGGFDSGRGACAVDLRTFLAPRCLCPSVIKQCNLVPAKTLRLSIRNTCNMHRPGLTCSGCAASAEGRGIGNHQRRMKGLTDLDRSPFTFTPILNTSDVNTTRFLRPRPKWQDQDQRHRK